VKIRYNGEGGVRYGRSRWRYDRTERVEYDMDGIGGDTIGRRGLSTIWTE